ncbi:hypothetical protein BGZ91_009416 [Linnemannia elongata]|nr:hypothetical protein BGZ91_009416 [Linnemannia elongata]
MPSPLVQDLMTESIAFVITACPAFMAGLNASTENSSGDQGDDDKENTQQSNHPKSAVYTRESQNSRATLVRLLPVKIESYLGGERRVFDLEEQEVKK